MVVIDNLGFCCFGGGLLRLLFGDFGVVCGL